MASRWVSYAVGAVPCAWVILWHIPRVSWELRARCAAHRGCRRGLVPVGGGGGGGGMLEVRDAADAQWDGFRAQLGILLAAMVGSVLLLRAVEGILGAGRRDAVGREKKEEEEEEEEEDGRAEGADGEGGKRAEWRLPVKLLFHLCFGIGFCLVLHGWAGARIVLVLCAVGYLPALLPSSSSSSSSAVARPLAAWAVALFVLFLKESYRLSPSASVLGRLAAMLFANGRGGGLYSWHFPMNFMALRIVSFHMDASWATASVASEPGAPAKSRPADTPQTRPQQRLWLASNEYFALVKRSHAMEDYQFLAFLAYCLYAPLYLAGPIVPFNAFLAQMHRPTSIITWRYIAIYAVRAAGILGLMELLTRMLPAFSIMYSGLFRSLPVPLMAVTGYVVLKLMWLKFLLLWRVFRLWALADGVETVENMPRCMSNNFKVSMFWKGWHASYNQWIIRYMYVPLGGTARRWFAVWPIFLFVGLWHDMEPKLFAWALLNSLFLVIELATEWLVTRVTKRDSITHTMLSCGLGAVTVLALMTVNLIGYSVGTSGMAAMWQKLLWAEDSLKTLFTSVGVLFCAVLLMTQLRKDGLSAA